VFLEQPLGEPDAAARAVSLEDLSRFLMNPAKAFLRRRLNIAFPETAEELSEREPFVLDGREQFRLKQQLVTLAAAAPAQALAAAAGTLPLGAVGQADFARAEARAAIFTRRLAGLRLPPAPPVDLAFPLGPFQVTGRLAEFSAHGPLFFRCAKLKARDLLNAWVHHLAANCVTRGRVTTLLFEDGRSRLAPPDDPAGLLGALLEFYWEGLRAPLKFFPESALAFATAEREGKPAPLEKARAAWEGNDFTKVRGEQEDAAFDCCFRGTDPLDDEFAAQARAVFGPLLTHEERTED
jgi:exodeoxyribonuclease V gamma subunit